MVAPSTAESISETAIRHLRRNCRGELFSVPGSSTFRKRILLFQKSRSMAFAIAKSLMRRPSVRNVREDRFHAPIAPFASLTWGKSDMRLVAIIFTAFVASGPAAAQSWTEYSYPEDLFTISFPGVPKAETTTRQGPDGRVVEARTYSVGQDRGAFKMAIVDLSDPPLDENVALDYAVKTLTQEGEVKLDIPARVNRVYGRQLSIDGTDGSHSSA